MTLLTALQQAVAPLADANARQAEELGRLREIARQQAEELGRLRERLAAIEAARSASADTSNGMHASTNVGPDVRQEHEGRRGTTQDERAALWRALATRALAVPAAMPPAPQAGLPRPRSRSLLGRVAAWIAEQSG